MSLNRLSAIFFEYRAASLPTGEREFKYGRLHLGMYITMSLPTGEREFK